MHRLWTNLWTTYSKVEVGTAAASLKRFVVSENRSLRGSKSLPCFRENVHIETNQEKYNFKAKQTRDECNFFVADLKKHLSEPELKLMYPASKLMQAVAAASEQACSLVVHLIIPLMLGLFAKHQQVSMSPFWCKLGSCAMCGSVVRVRAAFRDAVGDHLVQRQLAQ